MKSCTNGIKIIFELTNQCHFKSIHCFREEPEQGRFFSLAMMEKVLTEIQSYNSVDTIAFTGGEPTLHPDLQAIIQLITDFGYSFALVTNGWRFQKIFAKELEPFKPFINHISFSLDGAEAQTHDQLRCRPQSFHRIMQAITLCRFNNIPIHINMVITKINRHEIEAMAILASRLECDALAYAHCQPTPDALAADLVLNRPAQREVESEIAALQKTFRLPILLAGDHYNNALFYQCPQLQMQEFNIDYQGRLTACCQLSSFRGGLPDTEVIANLNQVSFYEAHQQLVTKIAQINREKITRLAHHELPITEAEHFICTHCMTHYQKIARSKELPITFYPQSDYDRRNALPA